MTALLAAAPLALHPALRAMPELPSRLAALFAEGRAAWPTLAIDPARLMAFVARTLNGDDVGEPTPDSLADAIDGLRAADLYLACTCASGDAAALAAFDRVYMREVDIALAKMRVGPPRSHDIKQLVRQRLFVGANGQDGKIADYAGRGDLRRWVRAVAVRTCLNELRRGKLEVLTGDDQLIAQHAMSGDDPEVEYMKRTYASEFRAAFAQALAALGAREQTLLRYHHVDGLNIDEIGAVYRVHRVTAFRWLEKSKEQLVKATLEVLRAKLRVSPGELESVLRMIRSQIHLSLVRQLGGPADRVDNVPDGDDEGIEEISDADLEDVLE